MLLAHKLNERGTIGLVSLWSISNSMVESNSDFLLNLFNGSQSTVYLYNFVELLSCTEICHYGQ